MSIRLVTNRVRTQSYNHPAGTAEWYNTLVSPQPSSFTRAKTCHDVADNPDGINPLNLTATDTLFWTLDGVSNGSSGWTYNGYARTGSPPAHRPATKPEPSFNTWLTSGLARTNPNRPLTDVPLFVKESWQIPFKLAKANLHGAKRFGNRPIRELADAHLTVQYGVLPFMKDLARMLDYANSVQRKLNEIRKLKERGEAGVSKSATVYEDINRANPANIVASPLYQEGNTIRYVVYTYRKRWVSTVWKPNDDLSYLQGTSELSMANRLAWGFDLSFQTLWDGMPWSWFVDWFSNIGDYAATYRNTIPVNFSGSCIMGSTETGIESAVKVSGPGTFQAKPNRVLRSEKLRFPQVAPPRPEFSLPFLDLRQQSILASILVVRNWNQ